MSSLAQELIDAVLIRDDHTCQMCGAQRGVKWETDPSRSNRIKVGSRFVAFEASELPTVDLCALCDECDEGIQDARQRVESAQWIYRTAHVNVTSSIQWSQERVAKSGVSNSL